MSLSVVIVTRNSALHIERLLAAVRSFADELVVAVDASSTDATEFISGRYADRLFRLEPFESVIEVALPWLFEQCGGDWILRLDDDELPSAGLVRALPRLMSDREVSHYWFRRRWLIEPDGALWLADSRWWPDWQLRMIRNIRSLIHTPARIHEVAEVLGAGQYVVDGAIYHLDHLIHTVEERRRKAWRYERSAPGNPHWEVYVPPSQEPLETQPVPLDDGIWESRATQRSVGATAENVSLLEMRAAHANAYEVGPDLFRATVTCLDCPSVMNAGQPRLLTLRVHNTGPFRWARLGGGEPGVRISYHWSLETGSMYQLDGLRTDLPQTVKSGQTIVVPAWVLPPNAPGRYWLQFDLVIEYVAWFTQHGWDGPRVEVRVDRAEYPLSARRAHSLKGILGIDGHDLDSPDTREAMSQKSMPAQYGRGSHLSRRQTQTRGLAWPRFVRSSPSVSILMPVYNGGRYVAEAVRSIQNQSFEDFDFIIVDDGSTDGTADILRQMASADRRLRVEFGHHVGVASSLNRGLALARGDFVARMDADDISLPHRLETQLGYMRSHPEYLLVGSGVVLIDAEGDEVPCADAYDPDIRLTHEEIDIALLTEGWPIVHPTVMMRTQAIREAGGYSSDFRAAQDHDLFLRLSERGRLGNLAAVLLKYRRHPASVTAAASRMGTNDVKVAIDRAVARRTRYA